MMTLSLPISINRFTLFHESDEFHSTKTRKRQRVSQSKHSAVSQHLNSKAQMLKSPTITQRRSMCSESSKSSIINHEANINYHSIIFRLSNGGEFLLQAHDDAEMQQWVGSLKAQCDQTGAESRSQTLPASSQKDEPKRRSFFTLKKK